MPFKNRTALKQSSCTPPFFIFSFIHSFTHPVFASVLVAQHYFSLNCREQLEKPLTFDSYKDRFRLLLQLEEIQMKKDIRHYDLKEVEMEEDRTDRRFLILEVSFIKSLYS